MPQPILQARDLLNIVIREEEKLADFRRRSNLLPGDLRWEMVSKDGNPLLHTFWPSNPAPVLFRGQTAVYDPCLSTLLRGLPLDWGAYDARDMTRFIWRHIQCAWFVEHLRHHPFARWAVGQSIDINTLAVAQHYGLPTFFIDLTESPAVAAFFATCNISRPAPGALHCTPIAEGVGILYRVRWHNLNFSSCRPIGLQPFPRPKQQWAWTYELWHGEDFQSPRCSQTPCVESIKFQHDAALSDHFLQRFDGGKALFPPDVMAEIADQVMDTTFIPADVARIVVRQISQDPDWAAKVPSYDRVVEMLHSDLHLDVRDGMQLLFTNDHSKRLASIKLEL